MLRVGIDIGGTFTDLVAIDQVTGRQFTAKLLTTPEDPSLAFKAGLRELLAGAGSSMTDIEALVHGTTLATNALVERRGARVVLVTTAGFRDILHIARERRYDIYDILFKLPPPLVPRRLCVGAMERTAANGSVLRPLDASALVRDLGPIVAAEGTAAVAVCFLHAHINPDNERAARAAIERAFDGLSVSLSSDLAPEPGEYERASTTVVNAYVQPLMQTYLGSLKRDLSAAAFRGSFYVMQSDGGLGTPDFAGRSPIHVIESGPAGGVQLGVAMARLLDRGDVLCFDMGGTTAKVCLIQSFRPHTTNQFEVAHARHSIPGSGLPVRAPFIDLVEIGTGGGSIAELDTMGLIKVGPASAGARPGPCCYGLGGKRPTVTDANLVLGYLRPDYFAGGAIKLDVAAARAAISEYISAPLGLPVEEAAWAIHEIANETMANAARLHAAQRGVDVTCFTMVATGGAGPMHAARLASKLGIREVAMPSIAGVASALGFLLSPVSSIATRSLPELLTSIDSRRVNAAIEEMEEQVLAEVMRGGVEKGRVQFQYTCTMAYAGQGSEIDVDFPGNRLSANWADLLRSAFEKRYVELYARLNPGQDLRVMSWRVAARGPQGRLEEIVRVSPNLEPTASGSRSAFDPAVGRFADFAVCRGTEISSSEPMSGPLIAEFAESTLIVPSGMMIRADRAGTIIMSHP